MTINTGFSRRRERNDRLPPGQYETRDFPVLSFGPTPHIDKAQWQLEVFGLVKHPTTWTWDEFAKLPHQDIHTDIHCVTRWSKLDTNWTGVGSAGIEEAVLVNTAGGDRLDTAVTALDHACVTLTTQTAERIYRALDEPARISTRLSVGQAARLAWCPQETIVFDRARVKRETHIALSSDAELLAVEWIVLGRAAHGESVAGGHVVDAWRVERNGRLVWADTLRITPDVFPHLRRSALLADCTTVATLVYCGPDLEKRLDCLRDWAASLECHAAATAVGGLIVVRFAAPATSSLRQGLRAVLQQFDRTFGPGPFRVPKMWSC